VAGLGVTTLGYLAGRMEQRRPTLKSPATAEPVG
jgi:hypothetical protein